MLYDALAQKSSFHPKVLQLGTSSH